MSAKQLNKPAMKRFRTRATHKGRIATPITAKLPVEVEETQKYFIVRAFFPGRDEDDMAISARKNVVTVRALRGETSTAKEGQPPQTPTYRVFNAKIPGPISRSLELPSNVDMHSVRTAMKNGQLNLRFKKTDRFTPGPNRLFFSTLPGPLHSGLPGGPTGPDDPDDF